MLLHVFAIACCYYIITLMSNYKLSLLRPYQIKTLEQVRQALSKKKLSVLFIYAGGGNARCASEITAEAPDNSKKGHGDSALRARWKLKALNALEFYEKNQRIPRVSECKELYNWIKLNSSRYAHGKLSQNQKKFIETHIPFIIRVNKDRKIREYIQEIEGAISNYRAINPSVRYAIRRQMKKASENPLSKGYESYGPVFDLFNEYLLLRMRRGPEAMEEVIPVKDDQLELIERMRECITEGYRMDYPSVAIVKKYIINSRGSKHRSDTLKTLESCFKDYSNYCKNRKSFNRKQKNGPCSPCELRSELVRVTRDRRVLDSKIRVRILNHLYDLKKEDSLTGPKEELLHLLDAYNNYLRVDRRGVIRLSLDKLEKSLKDGDILPSKEINEIITIFNEHSLKFSKLSRRDANALNKLAKTLSIYKRRWPPNSTGS